MNEKFFDFTDDERREWRLGGVTSSFLRWVNEAKLNAESDALAAIASGNFNGASGHGGRAAAYAAILDIAMRNK